jgi:hypothetical protein
MRAEGFHLTPPDILALLQKTTKKDDLFHSVTKIGDGLVVKRRGDTRQCVEALNSEFVRQRTDIPVPKVYLVFRVEGTTYIVSRLIAGSPL